MGRVIAISNQKGGVGKSTTTVNLGAGLARQDRTVLLVDMDPQGNTSLSMGIDPETKITVYDVIKGEAQAKDAIIKMDSSNISVLPANIQLCKAEQDLVSRMGRERLLADAMKGTVRAYDYIILDCPPSLGLLTQNALTFAREVLIPVQAEYFAMKGTSDLTATIRDVRKTTNPNLSITGVLLTLFSTRRGISKEVEDVVREQFGNRVFKTTIRDNVKLVEAPSHHQDIFTYAGKSYGAVDYGNLAKEIISQEG